MEAASHFWCCGFLVRFTINCQCCGSTISKYVQGTATGTGLGYESLLLTASLFCKQGCGGDGNLQRNRVGSDGNGLSRDCGRSATQAVVAPRAGGGDDNDILDGTDEQETRFRSQKGRDRRRMG